MSWCLQCGSEGRPTRATGVDEDGEPACVGHAVKELGAGLNAAAGRAPAVPAPIKQPAAAPSPVQTKAEDEMERATAKYSDKQCEDCGATFTPNGARSQFCIDCASARLAARQKAKSSKTKKAKKAKPQRDEILDAPKADALASSVYIERAQLAPVNEHVIDLQLSLRQTQVERLIKLLL